MRRIFAVLMALALLATACSSSGTNTPTASAPDTETSQNSENTSTESPPADDKLPAAEVSLGSSPDELAFSNWTVGSGTSFDDVYEAGTDYSWDTGLEEVEYSAPASNATAAEWIKVYSLTGGLGSGDYAGAAEFSTGEVADAYCLEYGDATPRFNQDGNLHRISGAGDLTFSLTNGQVDSLEKIMDAYNDADYWNGSSYDSRLYDGIASAIWSVTDGHGLNNAVAQDIMAKVQNGTYSNNTSSLYWARSDDRGIQDQMIIVPPGNGPETAPPEIPFVEETSACQVQLFDFPFGDGLLTTLGVGEYNLQGDLAWLNDDIESIYVPEGMTITVSEHHNGRGWTKFREGPGTFEVHDDQVSWIRIAGSCSPSATPVPTTPPAPTPVPAGSCHIDLFDFPNGQGELSSLGVGEYNLEGNLAWLNDDIESIYVPEGMTITVSEHYNGGGWTKFREGPGTFEVHDDQVSWIKVEGNCQPPATPVAPTATSTPPTATPTPPTATSTPPTATPVPPTATSVPPTPQPTPVPTTVPAPKLASIGDYVWIDADRDGVQDTSESPLAGVSVGLYDANTVRIATTVTDANGLYLFDDLVPGDYSVSVDGSTLPDGLAQTWDLDEILDNSSYETLSEAENNRDHDFGYAPLPTASIGDYVWLDVDSNGIQGGSEDGIAGVTVNLSDDSGSIVGTDTTDANGGYLFEDLPAGCYTVSVDDSTLPAGVTQTFDEDGTLDNTSAECLDPGEDDREQDFGYVAPEPASIGDFVWFDRNFNATPDAGEQGLQDITLELRSADGTLVATDITDADGLYLFEDLPAGCYTVIVDQATLPAFAVQTYDEDGTLDHTSSECLDPGEDDREQDFGYTIEPD